MTKPTTQSIDSTALVDEARGLFKRTGIYGLGQAFGRLVSLITLPLFTRYLSPAEFGVIALLAALSVAVRVLFGLDS